mmetsp:Transcript_4172/g.4812  ORF Transcript_4172/g.4812 Transcript_4172/m.4812 type:complete len:205 (-) Transcript_4172:886-1500(-)
MNTLSRRYFRCIPKMLPVAFGFRVSPHGSGAAAVTSVIIEVLGIQSSTHVPRFRVRDQFFVFRRHVFLVTARLVGVHFFVAEPFLLRCCSPHIFYTSGFASVNAKKSEGAHLNLWMVSDYLEGFRRCRCWYRCWRLSWCRCLCRCRRCASFGVCEVFKMRHKPPRRALLHPWTLLAEDAPPAVGCSVHRGAVRLAHAPVQAPIK